MCNTKHPVSSLPSGQPIGNKPEQDGTLPLTGEQTTTTMQPTKFSKLMKVVLPIIQGGAAGMTADPRGHGGGKAAQDFFQNEDALAVRQQDQTLRRQQIESENKHRTAQEETERMRANASGATYTHNNADGNRSRYRNNPQTGEEQELGEDPLTEAHTTLATDAGYMDFDRKNGQVNPVTNMAPEQTGSLPLKGQDSTLPLMPPERSNASKTRVLGQGQELIDTDRKSPSYGKPIAKGGPKTFAPRAPGAPKKPDAGKVETYAQRFLTNLNNDADAAIKKVEESNIPPEMKASIRARIREMARPGVAGRKRRLPSYRQQQPSAN